jgi:uncharacterized membrane protein YphA (DoxX/SURF4 family)
MFPQGGPGVALLLLRVSVVAFLSLAVANYNGSSLVLVGAVLISISLLIGFLTPFFCVMVAAFIIVNIIINPYASSALCVIAIANAVALGLLGPGAYSVDARLFGRRVTVVRPRKRANHSKTMLTL